MGLFIYDAHLGKKLPARLGENPVARMVKRTLQRSRHPPTVASAHGCISGQWLMCSALCACLVSMGTSYQTKPATIQDGGHKVWVVMGWYVSG